MTVQKLGKYELIEELGRGGYGTVYRARETVLDVERAVKVLHPALVADPEFIERFRREAQIAARLEHPNIVPVYELGEAEGRYYLAMKFMPGGSLRDLLAREGCLPFERALEITRQVAEALDFANNQLECLIHRDIKPGNILFESDGTARLADFGFAKALSGTRSASLSASGGMIGTPPYMAPEVWRGKDVSPATDVYSLACVIYEMITWDVLFQGQNPPEIMTKHILDGPQFPDVWPQGTPREITALLEKALVVDQEERHIDASEFISALENLTGEDKKELAEITDKVDQSQEIAPKSGQLLSVRRTYHWVFTVIVFLGLLAVGSIIGLTQTSFPFLSNVNFPSITSTEASTFFSTPMLISTSTSSSLIVPNITITNTPAPSATIAPTNTPTLVPTPAKIKSESVGKIVPLQTLGGNNGIVLDVVFSPDGATLVTGTNINVISWNIATGEKIRTFEKPTGVSAARTLAFSPDGSILAGGYVYDKIVLWDTKTGEQRQILDHRGVITSVDFSPDGTILASGSSNNDIILWDVISGAQVYTLRGHDNEVQSVAFSPDGKILASGSSDATIKLWDVLTGTFLGEFGGHHDWVLCLAFSPDGIVLASGGEGSRVNLWNVATREKMHTLEVPDGFVQSVSFSPDGTVLAGAENPIILWDVDTGDIIRTLEAHTSIVTSVAFSPDGKVLASGSHDGTVILWGISP